MQTEYRPRRLGRLAASTCGALLIIALLVGMTAFGGAKAQPTQSAISSGQANLTAPKHLKVLMLLYGFEDLVFGHGGVGIAGGHDRVFIRSLSGPSVAPMTSLLILSTMLE